jgi:benzoyl-CoA reductase/2-hydroxyglutaryl-CoA dehydratase subunit BcrC/BadD/HgdB
MRVFLTSPWIPAEWVRAHGLEPRGIWSAEPFARGAPALTAGVCAVAESVLRFAETQPDSAVVFTTACDQMRRAFDAAKFHGCTRVFLFNLPATHTAAARRLYRAELQRLGTFLVEQGGQAPLPENLKHEMRQTDDARRCLRGAAPLAAPRSFMDSVARFLDTGVFAAPAVAQPGHGVPLALVGGPWSAADGDLFQAIETAGGSVVLNATEVGERSLAPVFDGADQRPSAGLNLHHSPDAFELLADGCFDGMVDVFQRPNIRLYDWLRPRLLARQVRGIVLWCHTACDLWRAEMQGLREGFGLPVLLLESGETGAISPRDNTRLQAFVEALE